MTRRDVHEAQRLQRLRALREDAARAALDRCRAAEAAALAVVQRRESQIHGLRRDRVALLDWWSGEGAAQAPQATPLASARLAALNDEIERAEVDLIDERNALRRAAKETEAAHAAWRQAHARRSAVDELSLHTRRAFGRAQEVRAERELDAPVPQDTLT